MVSFLKGARGLHSPCPPAVPPCGLEVVFRALSQPPFEPVTSDDLKELSFKTVILLALALAKSRRRTNWNALQHAKIVFSLKEHSRVRLFKDDVASGKLDIASL